MVSTPDKREIFEALIFIAISVFFATILVLLFGFVSHGFDDPAYQSKFYFYGISFGALILFVMSFKIIEHFNPEKAQALIHDPDKPYAIIPKGIKFLRSPVKLALICIILFGWFSFALSQSQTSFIRSGVPILQVKQQIAPSAQVLSFMEPASTVETWWFLAFLAIFLTIPLYLSNGGKKRWLYFLLIASLPIVFGFGGVGIHQLVYGGKDIALTNVFLFWSIGTAIVLMFGSVYPIWIWHVFNNLWAGVSTTFGKESYVAISFIFLIFLTILCGVLLYLLREKKDQYPNFSKPENFPSAR